MEEVLHTPVQRSRGNRATTLVACIAAACALAIVVASGLVLYSQATATDFTAKIWRPRLPTPSAPTGWVATCFRARLRACPQACWWACWRPPSHRLLHSCSGVLPRLAENASMP